MRWDLFVENDQLEWTIQVLLYQFYSQLEQNIDKKISKMIKTLK